MFEYLLNFGQDPNIVPDSSPVYPPVSSPVYSTTAFGGSNKLVLPDNIDTSYTDMGHSAAQSYDGRFIVTPRFNNKQSLIFDVGTPMSGNKHLVVGEVQDGGAVAGSLDIEILWFKDYLNPTNLRQWRRVGASGTFEYELAHVIDMEPLSSVQSHTDTPVISGDGNTVWTGEYIRKYDDVQMVDEVYIGANVLNVVISETGKRFVTIRSTDKIVMDLWEKPKLDGEWSIIASTSFDATFEKRVHDANETTYITASANYDLSRFAVVINRVAEVFDVDGDVITHVASNKLRKNVSLDLPLFVGRGLVRFNRAGTVMITLSRNGNGTTNNDVEKYALNPNTGAWDYITTSLFLNNAVTAKNTSINISGDSNMLCYSVQQPSTGSGPVYFNRSLVAGMPTW